MKYYHYSILLFFQNSIKKSLYLQTLKTPRVGFEPTTLRLTAECSAAELSRIIIEGVPSKPHTNQIFFIHLLPIHYLLGYALDRLVTVSSVCYHTSTSVLSTLSSSRGLTTCVGISHLEGGFTLRCLQRLSLPDLATLPCSWQNNRYTSGPSNPVLSY